MELLQKFDEKVIAEFKKPLLKFSENEIKEQLENFKKEFGIKSDYKYIVFHPGFGGSSDGNLNLDDYIALAKSIYKEEHIKVVFTFGPDDLMSKQYIEKKLDFDAILFQSKLFLIDFCKLLANFELFVSTSTGPMHLAGAVNIKTISFFGDSLFASAKRWATISEKEKQRNFSIPENYDKDLYLTIENKLKEIIV